MQNLNKNIKNKNIQNSNKYIKNKNVQNIQKADKNINKIDTIYCFQPLRDYSSLPTPRII